LKESLLLNKLISLVVGGGDGGMVVVVVVLIQSKLNPMEVQQNYAWSCHRYPEDQALSSAVKKKSSLLS